MNSQVGPLYESLPTTIAFIWHLSSLSVSIQISYMGSQMNFESFLSSEFSDAVLVLTGEWLGFRVDEDVGLQVPLGHVGFEADRAGKRPQISKI